MAEKKTNKKSGTLNRYFFKKTWFKTKHSLISQDEVNHRIYNGLPLNDLFDAQESKYGTRNPDSKKPGKKTGNEGM